MHQEGQPYRKHGFLGMVTDTVFVCSRNEMTEEGHSHEESKRQSSTLSGSRRQQEKVPLQEVLLLGSTSRHLLCSLFPWERAFKQDLLGRRLADPLYVGLGTCSPVDSTCEMHFPSK